MESKSVPLQFDIIYGDDSHTIDSTTLTTSILNFSNLLQEINFEVNPGTRLDIRIEAFAPSSFKVKSKLSTKQNENALIPNQEASKEVMETAKDIIDIKKHLGGEKPKEVKYNDNGENVEIINTKGNIIIKRVKSYKILGSNKQVDSYLTNTFRAVEDDSNIKDFRVDLENSSYIEVERSEFPLMRKSSILDDVKTRENVKNQVELIIFKVVMEKGYKWDFLYAGGKISADILDQTLFDNIDEGLKFGKGDRLIGDLRIVEEFNESLQAFEIKRYEVIRFYEKQDRPTEFKLFE